MQGFGISGLGYYEAYINGQKQVIMYWIRVDKLQQAVFAAVYDITKHICNGANAAGIMLGNGWTTPLARCQEVCIA